MKHKNLIVLGASSDIGKSLLQKASKDSSLSILAVSRSESLHKLEASSRINFLSGYDLTSENCLAQLSSKAKELFEGPITVVHCVGDFWHHKPLVDTKFSEIASMLTSHVLTLFGIAKYLTPVLIENGGGQLIAFSCNSVIYNYPDMAPFTASKAAIESFTKSYANEYAGYGISACAVALPTIRTPKVLLEKVDGDHKNYVTPEDLASFILDELLTMPQIVNGNVVKLFKHSSTFYNKSYYDRNPRGRSSLDSISVK